MKRFAGVSRATPFGDARLAEAAGPLSPNPLFPPPAKVVIVPPLTLRTRLFPESLMYTLPIESAAMPNGWDRNALVAGPLSPPKLGELPPAKVTTLPWVIFRTRVLESWKETADEPSTAT